MVHPPLARSKWMSSTDSLIHQQVPYEQVGVIPTGLHPGAFGVKRQFHTHEGVDIYGSAGENVFNMLSGVIEAIIPNFTGPSAVPPSPWWNSTAAVVVRTGNLFVLYGEINIRRTPVLQVGEYVRSGFILGDISTVLTVDKGRPMSMLHMETYSDRVEYGLPWVDVKPPGLLDPTSLLLTLTLI